MKIRNNKGFTLIELFIVIAIIGILAFVGISAIGTDATRSKFFALGSPADIKCYSGGKLIFEGKSTGKVQSEQTSDGYYFKDKADGRLKEVSGNCVIAYK